MRIEKLSKENVKELIDKLDIEQVESIEINNQIIEEYRSIDTIVKRKVLTIVVNHNKYEEPRDNSYIFR